MGEKNSFRQQQLLESLYWALGHFVHQILYKKTSIKNMFITFCPMTCNVRITSYKKERKNIILLGIIEIWIYMVKKKQKNNYPHPFS